MAASACIDAEVGGQLALGCSLREGEEGEGFVRLVSVVGVVRFVAVVRLLGKRKCEGEGGSAGGTGLGLDAAVG